MVICNGYHFVFGLGNKRDLSFTEICQTLSSNLNIEIIIYLYLSIRILTVDISYAIVKVLIKVLFGKDMQNSGNPVALSA